MSRSKLKKILKDGTLILLIVMILDVLTAQAVKLLPGGLSIETDEYWKWSDTLDHVLLPNLDRRAAWVDTTYRLTTNSLGFKDARPREVQKSVSGQRLLILGDSFTEGVGIEFSDTFAGFLKARLAADGISVLNGGTFSYAPAMYYRRARQLIEEGYEIDHILVMIDLSDIPNEAASYRLDKDGNVRARIPQPKSAKIKILLKENSITIRLLDILTDRMQQQKLVARAEKGSPVLINTELAGWTLEPEKIAAAASGLRAAREHMNLLADLIKKQDIGLTIGVYPWPDQIFYRDLDSIQVRFWRNWARENGAGFINLFPLFIGESPPLDVIKKNFIPYDTHWNAAGHKIVGQALLPLIRKNMGRE
jgi:lysophospholipase L1-like esterase